MNKTAERNESLWWLSVSPLIWMSHLLLIYGTAAIACAKAGPADVPMRTVRLTVLVLTVVALAGVAATGFRGFKRHRFDHGSLPHDQDTPEDRHRFLGFAILLLSGLSAVGIIFVALPAVFIETCR